MQLIKALWIGLVIADLDLFLRPNTSLFIVFLHYVRDYQNHGLEYFFQLPTRPRMFVILNLGKHNILQKHIPAGYLMFSVCKCHQSYYDKRLSVRITLPSSFCHNPFCHFSITCRQSYFFTRYYLQENNL